MNKSQRKLLAGVITDLGPLTDADELSEDHAKYTAIVKVQTMVVEDCLEKEQEKFDNMSEGSQDGERGQAMQAAIESMESARDSLSSAVDVVEGEDWAVDFAAEVQEAVTALEEIE